MAWTVQEVVAARDTLAGLLEELRLSDHLFGIEPLDEGWTVRVECRSREGSQVNSFGIEAGVLERCADPRVRRRLRRFLSERLGDCIRQARPSVPPPLEDDADEEDWGADASTLAAVSEYSSTAGGSQRSEPVVLLPPPIDEHPMSHVESPEPLRDELYWYALEQATQDPHPPESDLPPAEVAAMHLVPEEDEGPRERRGVGRSGETTVSDVMTRDVEAVGPGTSLDEVRALFAELSMQHMPVTEGDRLVGVISSNDVLRLRIEPLRRPRRSGRLQARHLMQAPPATVRDDATLREAAATLCEGSFHALPVVDADQRLVGMVSSTDLIRRLAGR